MRQGGPNRFGGNANVQIDLLGYAYYGGGRLADEVKVMGIQNNLTPQDIIDRVAPNARSTNPSSRWDF